MKYVTKQDAFENGRVTLSYNFEMGWQGAERFCPGWNHTGCSYNSTCRYTPEEYKTKHDRLLAGDVDWNYPKVEDAFKPGTIFEQEHSGVNFVFYNRGLWGRLENEAARAIMRSISDFTFAGTKRSDASNRCFFRSTTSCGRTRERGLRLWEHSTMRAATHESGCEYLDFGRLTEEFGALKAPGRNKTHPSASVFVDHVHYQPWVYEELNIILLNVLCNGQ